MGRNSREIVRAAVEFTGPERLPVKMAALGVSDTAGVPVRHKRREVDGREGDEWGVVWEKSEVHNMGQPRGHLLGDLSEVGKVVPPDYEEDFHYEDCEAALREAEKQGKYTTAGIFMVLFERMHALAGFENVLMGLLADREHAAALADRILEARLCFVRNMQERFGERLDSFGMSEDWGTQEAAFVSAELWYDFFYPRYRRLFDAMHEGGQHVWVHSCGKINEIIQGFIDAGVDVINLQQPRALGIEEVGRRYRGSITFESLADIQASLPTGRADPIEEDAEALARHWMTPEGGFVFSDYGDDAAIGADQGAKLTMYRAFSRVSEELYGNPLPEPRVPAGR